MPLFPRPLLTNGATHPAEQFRMMIRDMVSGAEGITEGDDLKVTELDTPGGGVQISDGSGVVRGRVQPFQGHYAVCNTGTDTSVEIAANGGGATRYDMVIVRVEDPEYEGTLDPAADEITYFQVISSVGAADTEIPDGRTGIPLARIEIPPATSTITDAMITDLRQVAVPRRRRSVFLQSPASLSSAIGGSTSWSYFSTAAGVNITVPDWATKAIVKIDVSSIRYNLGFFYGKIGATYGASLTTQDVVLDDNQGSGIRRVPGIVADTFTIPDAYRGTVQLLRVRAAGLDAGQAGRIYVDSGTTFVYDIQFEEGPR